MSTLAQLQRRLQAAITGDEAAPAAGRLHVYRHAYRARLAAALRDNLGVLPRAMGDEAFDALAHAYLASHPSRTPSIRWFGDALVAFMSTRDDLVPHPAFIDLARMEWALRGAFDAADAPLLTREALAALPAEAWPTLVLRLHPSAQLLSLDWAIEPAWKALQGDGGDTDLPEPQPHPHTLLVWRPVLETRWRSARHALEAQLLDAVRAGQPFADLCEQAAQSVGEAQAAATVVGLLQQWVDEGLLAGAGG